MNTGTFAGYLGGDAVLRATPSQKEVLNFSLGVTVGFGDNKRTLWVGCALWGDRAPKLEPYLLKGQALVVTGDVDLRMYDKRDGTTAAELTVNVQRVTMLGKKDGAARERPATQGPKEPAQQRAASEDFDDDIPF